MVTLIVGSQGEIDLAIPLHVYGEKRDRLIAFMKHLIPELEIVENVVEPDIHMEREKYVSKGVWQRDELLELLKIGPNEEKTKKLGRSEMSVGMKRASFYSAYLDWLKKKKLLNKDAPATRKQFVDEALSE